LGSKQDKEIKSISDFADVLDEISTLSVDAGLPLAVLEPIYCGEIGAMTHGGCGGKLAALGNDALQVCREHCIIL
jgi:hypothetical protein